MLALSAMVFECDLSPGREGVGSGASPVAVGLGCSLESLDVKVIGSGRPRM